MKSRKTTDKANLVEKIYLSRKDLVQTEKIIVRNEHLRRYAAIRRFCYGKTLDMACGCGYGSFLLAVNPDVSGVTAVDCDREAIEWATREFKHPKINYLEKKTSTIKGNFDTLVCLETIEHLKDRNTIPDLVKRCSINNIIISFPDKKSTHFNPFHFHDFVRQEIIDIFPQHLPYHTLRFVDCESVLLMRIPKNAPAHIFRNLRDL